MKRRKPGLVMWFGGGFLTLLLLILLAIIVFIRSPFPKERGKTFLQGITKTVEIYRDENGVPHIYGETPDDLYFAQGYAHAQDRFWQMEFWRRIGSGSLSELLGDSLVDTDRFLRTMGFAKIASLEYSQLKGVDKENLDSYCRGVNAYISTRKPSRLGLEFAILSLTGVDIKIAEWTGVHTLTWAKMMAYDLSVNMAVEKRIIEVMRSGGLPLLEAYNTAYRKDMPYIVSMDELNKFRDYWNINSADFPDPPIHKMTFVRNGGEGLGSNSWVIGPELTKSGHPLVANDMHLGVQMPSIWYEVGLHLVNHREKLDLRGYSFPGIPGIVTGQNDDIAWGVTNQYGDVQDYFIEKINPVNPDQYWNNGGWEDMDISLETIYREGEDEPVVHRVRKTVRGPILSDLEAFSGLGGYYIDQAWDFPENVGLTAVSLSWVALEPSQLMSSLFAINRASTMSQFREGLSRWYVPGQNFVYADKLGNIAYQATGKHPVRTRHLGKVPGSGSGGDGWIGSIPFDLLPGIINPEKKYIVTANNPVISPAYEYLIGLENPNGYRARQILERINSSGKSVTIENMMDIQGDLFSLHAKELIAELNRLSLEYSYGLWKEKKIGRVKEGILSEEPDDEKNMKFLEEAMKSLNEWDFIMDTKSSGAAVYEFIWYQVIVNTFRDNVVNWKEIPGHVPAMESAFEYLRQHPEHILWDDKLTKAVENKDDILAVSLIGGLFEGREQLGKFPSKWEWGKVHTIEFRNASLGESGIGLIENMFNRGPYAAPGSTNTVNKSHWILSDPYKVTSCVSQRSIVDPVDPSQSVFIHPTGQSGHPFHKHYDDFIQDWIDVKYHKGRWNKEDVQESAGRRLLLLIPE